MGTPFREFAFRSSRETEQIENESELDREYLPSARERLDRVFEGQEGLSTAELKEAIETIGGVRASVFRAYLVVLEYPESTVSEVATILETGYSTAHRRLKQLLEKGLVSRQRVISSDGGHRYYYQAQSLAETNRWLRREIDEWQNAVNEQVEALQTASTA